MATPLILHVGQSKTGTTTIQDFLCNHRRDLLQEGILYPDTGRQRRAQHKLAAMFLGRTDGVAWIAKVDADSLKRAFDDEVAAVRPHTVIVSSEVFFNARDIDQLKRWFDGFDVRIVVLLRRQDLWADSMYQQQLKSGKTGLDHREWLSAHARLLDYAQRVGRWADIFGESAVRVGVFEPGRIKAGLVAYFFQTAGIRSSLELADPVLHNPRLSRGALEYLRQLGGAGISRGERKRVRIVLEEYSRLHPDPARWRSFFSPEERRAILEKCASGNAAIARRFLGRTDGLLFDDVEIEPEFEQYPGLAPDAAARVRDFVATALAGRQPKPV
jgi:capsular polysaccharide export protein